MKILRVFLLSVALMAGAAQAAGPELLRQRVMMEVLVHRSVAEFSFYVLQHGDTRATQRLEKVLADANELIPVVGEEWPAIMLEWGRMHDFLLSHREAALDGDVNLPARLEVQQNQVYRAFDDNRPAHSLPAGDKTTLMYMLDSLERMLASYLFFNINIFGSHAVTDTGIEQQSQRFEELLQQLQNKTLRDDISRKWSFVKTTLLAYNERSAVYIVDRTGQSIRDQLTAALQ